MTQNQTRHYDQSYFAWQASIGEFGGWANQTKFQDYLCPTDTVLDFGCGGGFLLKGLPCAKKVGVEINETAADNARALGIEVYPQVKTVPDNYVDVIISNNALEHTLHPLLELQSLYPKLRAGGRIVFVVPCESIQYHYKPGDRNHHLYSWSPMCIGNLFTEAGYTVLESKPYIHKWPPKYRQVARFGGRKLFELACRIYGQMERAWFQVRVVAEKPSL